MYYAMNCQYMNIICLTFYVARYFHHFFRLKYLTIGKYKNNKQSD